MILECRCGTEHEIDYNISGYNLVDTIINIKCHKCQCFVTLYIAFPENEKGKTKTRIEYSKTDYIG